MTFDRLILSLKNRFTSLSDTRCGNPTISLVNALLSGFAIYSLKYSSLLSFINDMMAGDHNLKNVYHITQKMSDTGMRQIIDKVETSDLQPLLGTYVREFESTGELRSHRVLGSYYYIAIDGTQYFKSKTCKCNKCLIRKHRDGSETYHHNALAGVLVHPAHSTVFPVGLEDISKQDGRTKNDCELVAVQRLLPNLRTALPDAKIIIGGDALYSNAPFIRSLTKKEHDFSFVLSIKQGNQPHPFSQFNEAKASGTVKVLTLHHPTRVLRFEWLNKVTLNTSNQDIKVNFMSAEEKDRKTGKKKIFYFITDINITNHNIDELVKIGRSRWKIENETFNTLKNQGYHFEHNFGHGKQHLASNLAQLMMLAFLFDQIQQHNNKEFKEALLKVKTKKALWQKVRAIFEWIPVTSMKDILQIVARKRKLKVGFIT